MADISIQSNKRGNNSIIERRKGERRSRQRRNISDMAGHYNGTERRIANTDRRTTIVNRLNREVTDRRTLN